jgi:hypothetical protein
MPEAVEEAAFGHFEPVPGGVMAGLAQVGKHLGEAAGPAEGLRVARRHRPVTDVGLRIVLAETIEAPGRGRQRRLPPRVPRGV